MITIALAAAIAVAPIGAPVKSISIKGSDTLLILNQRWAEAYESVDPNVSVAVTGGGSSIGINAFINGVADIAASSRPMKKSEIDKARSRGSLSNAIPVALDGLAILVNGANPVKSLTMQQLAAIYTGRVKNWKQVGGPDLGIVVFSRDSNSGTYGFFQENVLRNTAWGGATRFLPSTSEEAREVARTKGGIAYGGVAYFKNKANTNIVAVAPRAGVAGVMPTEDMVRSKKYPIWRYLYYYTNGKPKGDIAKFIRFCLSAEGQKIVERVGYYSVK
ncbi:MAG: phosphate ABC transporter substrate-binding protein [Armatimonadetes bacterium]|nr:phosphate ABC transporter substrate-binding protein [Armatimonadota bacterium]